MFLIGDEIKRSTAETEVNGVGENSIYVDGGFDLMHIGHYNAIR